VKIPGYTIVRELGQGGMATVYLARQDRLARDVALKVMKPLAMAGDDFTSRFVKEGQIIAQLAHPQIITIYDFNSTDDGEHYFSMEYLPGGTLADEIQRGLPIGRTIAIARKIAEALAVAHARGVIHRDVKPQNILFRADGTPVLTDFGIARAVTRNPDSMQLTRFGMVIGSPRYMSPEQSLGRPLDPRSDLYSLGVLFYEMLTNRLPYEADDVVSLAMKHCQDPIPQLPDRLAVYQPILDRLIAKKPEDRFASAGQLIRALEALEGANGESHDATRLIRRDAETGLAPAPESHLAPESESEPESKSESTPRAKRSVPWRLFLALAIVLLTGLGIYFGLSPAPSGPDSDILAQLPPDQLDRPPTATQYEALALDHYRRGQIEQTQEIIRLALATTPDDARLLALRGLIERGITVGQRRDEARQALAEDRVEVASQAVDEGLRLDPRHSELLSLRAGIQERLAARRRLDAERRLQTAREAQRSGDLDAAERLAREGLALVEDHPELLALLEAIAQTRQRQSRLERLHEQAIVRHDQGDYSGAFALIDEGLVLAPEHPGLIALREKVIATLVREARNHLIRVADERVASITALLDRYQLDEAAARLEQLRALAPDDVQLAELSADLERRRAFFPVMREIPSGCFEMGSPETEAGRESDERLHQVCVESFRLASHEVTLAQFERFVTASGYRTDAENGRSEAKGCESLDRDDKTDPWGMKSWASWRKPNQYQANDEHHPVSCVSWNDARAYIDWLNQETGHAFRMPTEAEWEYAARAGTQTAHFWDANPNAVACRHVNSADQGQGWESGFDCDDGYEWVAPVGQFAPNAWGLHDMLGNVWEWTCSEYDADYQGVERLCAPPEIDLPRVMRGGAWNSGPALVRAAYRNRNFPEARYGFVGFRLALDIPAERP
jgi:formylglycine-generating enzyme required for sulfatase activity/serine/threonine protein kinase